MMDNFTHCPMCQIEMWEVPYLMLGEIHFRCPECNRSFSVKALDRMAKHIPEYTMSEIQCHQCGSNDWYCWDEQTDKGWGSENGNEFDDEIFRVIGYLGCNRCGASWLDFDPPYPLPAGYFPEGHGSLEELMQ
jgi:hypothetical protein